MQQPILHPATSLDKPKELPAFASNFINLDSTEFKISDMVDKDEKYLIAQERRVLDNWISINVGLTINPSDTVDIDRIMPSPIKTPALWFRPDLGKEFFCSEPSKIPMTSDTTLPVKHLWLLRVTCSTKPGFTFPPKSDRTVVEVTPETVDDLTITSILDKGKNLSLYTTNHSVANKLKDLFNKFKPCSIPNTVNIDNGKAFEFHEERVIGVNGKWMFPCSVLTTMEGQAGELTEDFKIADVEMGDNDKILFTYTTDANVSKHWVNSLREKYNTPKGDIKHLDPVKGKFYTIDMRTRTWIKDNEPINVDVVIITNLTAKE